MRSPATHSRRELGPPVRFQLPDAGVRRLPPFLDDPHGDVDGAPPVLGQLAAAPGRCHELEDFAESVQLELPVHPVARLVRPARIAAQPRELLLTGHPPAADEIGGLEVRTVREEALSHETRRSSHQLVRPLGGHRDARQALVSHPGIPVVVVPPGLCSLREAHCRRRHHPARGRREASQYRVGVTGVAASHRRRAWGGHFRPGVLCCRPGPGGVGQLSRKRSLGDLEHEVVVSARLERQLATEAASGRSQPAGLAGATPAEPQWAGPPLDNLDHDAVTLANLARAADLPHAVASETCPRVEPHAHVARTVHRRHPAKKDGALHLTGKGERLPALHNAVCGREPAVPDQGCFLVVSAPDEPWVHRADDVAPTTAYQGREHRVGVPGRRAHPNNLASWSDESAPFAVSDERVFAEDMG